MLGVRIRMYARSTAVLRLRRLFRTHTYCCCRGKRLRVEWHKYTHTHIDAYYTTMLYYITSVMLQLWCYNTTSLVLLVDVSSCPF